MTEFTFATSVSPRISGARALAEGAVSHGLNVAVVEYTLAPEARMDRIVGEVRHAISWLHEHLGDYGADPGRIYVAGHSAGAHLTAMTMPLGVNPGKGTYRDIGFSVPDCRLSNSLSGP